MIPVLCDGIGALEKFRVALLNVWQEACRHIEMGQCTQRIAALLVEELPVCQVVVREVLPNDRAIETVAVGFPERAGDLFGRTECSDDVIAGLAEWSQGAGLIHCESEERGPMARALVPEATRGEAICGPLGSSATGFGVLVLIAADGKAFRKRDEELATALLQPFSAAFENDHRLRELAALRKAAEADKRSLLTRLGRERLGDTIVGEQTGLREVMERVDLVGHSTAPVMIFGETGSGKELIARAIHMRSPRREGAFLRVNCGAIPADLIDSQLFGHEKGAFTDAVATRPGWFERADGGTLFLDEIGELPPAAQVRLLRVLQDGWMERVGGHQPIHVDVRIIAATNRDLAAMVATGDFRQDLWYRIAVFPIVLPPLRERREDIAGLAEHFAERAAHRFGLRLAQPTVGDVTLLKSYDWPGNVREFAAVIDRAAILGDGQRLEIAKALGLDGRDWSCPRADDAAVAPGRPDDRRALPSLAEATRAHIETALRYTEGRIEGPHGAANLLRVNPHTLRAKMRKLGIDWASFRTSSHCVS